MATMNGATKDTLNMVGFILRFLLPAMIAVGGYLTMDKLNTITATQQSFRSDVVDIKKGQVEIGESVAGMSEKLNGVNEKVRRNEQDIRENDGRIRRIEIRNINGRD